MANEGENLRSGASGRGGVLVEKVVSVPFDENTYIFRLCDHEECVVFDPGLQPGAIIELIEQQNLAPAAILCTHGHTDHIAGNERLKERWPDCPLVIGRGDEPKLSDPEGNLSAQFGFSVVSPPADQTVVGGDLYEAAGIRWRVLDTPGHSSGHVSFIAQIESGTHCVSGDVLFQRSIGRTDFPDGNFDALRDSIHTQLFTLPDDTIVYPGHGPETTVGQEKQENPFVGVAAGYAFDA